MISKPNSKVEAGKTAPATSHSLIQGLSSETPPKNLGKAKPSARHAGSPTCPQRVQHSRFFGASSVASALDLRPRRDPEADGLTSRCLALHWSYAAR
jgi:hypothetical protein